MHRSGDGQSKCGDKCVNLALFYNIVDVIKSSFHVGFKTRAWRTAQVPGSTLSALNNIGRDNSNDAQRQRSQKI